MCGINDIVAVASPPVPFDGETREEYLEKIWLGIITKDKLDVAIYTETVAYLTNGLKAGFGGLTDDFTFGSGLSDSSRKLESSLFRFSAAKQYQEVRILSRLAYQSEGWKEFNEVATSMFGQFNDNWLRTEWQTAVQQGQTARDWVDLQENEFVEMLRYVTEQDGRVRPEHEALHGITLPKDDPFWLSYYPANGWNCRCFVEGLELGKATDLAKRNIPEWGSAEMPKEFKYNAGRDGLVFTDKHPYYKVAKGDVALRENNFNLPMP